LCKYYDNNQILNEQLLEIKSAQTADEFEKLFKQQYRHNQGFLKSAKSVEPYYDIEEVLTPLKPFSSETCPCTKDVYRFNNYRLVNERQQPPTPTVCSPSDAIKGLDYKASLDEFVHLASECYDKCINVYLNNLNDCNKRAESIERQSIRSSSGHSGKYSLKAKKINDLSLVNRINKLCINLEAYRRDFVSQSSDNFPSTRQSISSLHDCSHQAMSCNDTNNNGTDSTNQLKDPPKIILSDHSTNHTIQGDRNKEICDKSSTIDKNCLTIPNENYYSSEARPP
jgi:hypothetical protein